jgi:hypothetical protein
MRKWNIIHRYNASTKNEMYLIESETLVTSSTPRTVTHKTDCHNITEILLKVVLNTISLTTRTVVRYVK